MGIEEGSEKRPRPSNVGGSRPGDQVIATRDRQPPDGPVLIFTPAEWEAFTLGVQDGEFDLA